MLMSHIIADHLRDRKEIKIYDPASASGSLLLNIGRAVAKHKIADLRFKSKSSKYACP
ncbi:N-6 DNA methylase [Arcanobacterium phocae]|uniref:N-6 DNA methylase n=1 Tax=Arcanobacterium phocae TaxID=131112 RepID=UPI00209CB15D|nr:N-6 DNA methylase [Arcanobacterium phocae]